jgi:hypothetical protein
VQPELRLLAAVAADLFAAGVFLGTVIISFAPSGANAAS